MNIYVYNPYVFIVLIHVRVHLHIILNALN